MLVLSWESNPIVGQYPAIQRYGGFRFAQPSIGGITPSRPA